MRGSSLTPALAVLLLAGCATFSPDGGFEHVAAMTRERTGSEPSWQRNASDADAVRTRVQELLRAPLMPQGAVELALLNNPVLQAEYQDLRVAEAELVQAGRLRNPTFSFSRLAAGHHVEIERALVIDVLSLLSMPLAVEVEQGRFAQTQAEVALRAVGIAADARRAYFAAVASGELVSYYTQVKATADASAELARRMVEAGNFSKLAQMREHAFYADATTQLARARHQASIDRERLVRVLGLPGEEMLMLPDRLPALPKTPLEPKDAEQTAMDRRLDVQRARRSSEALAKSLDLTSRTGFINVLHAGYANTSETDERRKNGYEIELELPLFDFGTSRLTRAEATYMQAVHRTGAVALQARSEVREFYSAYRTTFDIARHYRDEIVPLRKRISEENLLRYNGMLIGVFELLADARDQVVSVTAAVEALRDFWLADTNLHFAMTSGSPGGGPSMSAARGASAATSGAAH